MKFINNHKNEVIENALNGFMDRLNNDFYIYQSNYILGVYYNIDETFSGAAKNVELIETSIGVNSPLKYNKYMNMPIAGMSDIDVNIELDEFGEEGSSIEGEIFLFPNTIIPAAEDRFILNHMPHLLFKVTSTSTLKLDSGKNMWRLTYKLDKINKSKTNIEELVLDTYHIIIENIGSDMKVAIKDDIYDKVKSLDVILSDIKNQYMCNFYSKKVDTLILEYDCKFIYDAMLIEFIIRNDLLSDENIKTIFYHHLENDMSFNNNFNNTIFNAIMKNDISKFKTNSFNIRKIEDQLSTFLTQNNDYFEVTKGDNKDFFFSKFSYFPVEIELEIKNINSKEPIIKIINSCINNRSINSNDIYLLESIEIEHTKYWFYLTPLLIYSIDKYIKNLLSKSNK